MQVQSSSSIYAAHRLLSISMDVASVEQIQTFSSKFRLLHENENIKDVYVVKEGVLKTGVLLGGKEVNVDFALPGDLIGVSLLYNHVSSFFVESVTDVVLYKWEINKLSELMSLLPEVNSVVLTLNSCWNKMLIERFKNFSLMNAKERVVSWVNEVLNYERYVENKLWDLLSKEDMAAYCGVEVKEYVWLINSLVASGELRFVNGLPKELVV